MKKVILLSSCLIFASCGVKISDEIQIEATCQGLTGGIHMIMENRVKGSGYISYLNWVSDTSVGEWESENVILETDFAGMLPSLPNAGYMALQQVMGDDGRGTKRWMLSIMSYDSNDQAWVNVSGVCDESNIIYAPI